MFLAGGITASLLEPFKMAVQVGDRRKSRAESLPSGKEHQTSKLAEG
jgi:hypothetical protein